MILIVAMLAVRALRRSSAAVRHAVLTSALLSTVALPLLSQVLPRLEVPTPVVFSQPKVPTESPPVQLEPESNYQPTEIANDATDDAANQTTSPVAGITSASLEAPVSQAASAHTIRLAHVASAVWMVGMLSLLVVIVVGEVGALRLRRTSNALPEGEWSQSLAEISGQHRPMRRVVLLENSTIQVPMTCGTLRPAILIPAGFHATADERRRILLHEMAHVVRFDVALQTLGRLACALYWFHPLAWWCLRQMHREREQACDDWVVRSGERATEYADQLIALAKRNLTERPLPAAVGIVRRGNLEKRVHAMLNSDCSHAAMGRVRGTLLVALCLCVVASLAVLQPRPTIAAGPDDSAPQNTQEESADQADASKHDPTKTDSYTFPIRMTGLALDEAGNPIAGATVYVSSQRVLWAGKRIAETTTDESGRYTFEEIELPITRADTNHGRDHGGFLVFGTAQGYGFAWRPLKWFYPSPQPGRSSYVDPAGDEPSQFYVDDKIELDLTFPAAATIRGTIVDGNGEPIPKTKLAIWDAERIPLDAYGSRRPGSDRQPFRIMASDGFELLNADVPPEMWITHSDAEGRFEFTGAPSGRRFRVKVQPPGFPSRMVWFTTRAGLEESYGDRRLYDASQDIRLTFENSVKVPIQVVYADTGQPAPKAFVNANNKLASALDTTDEQGRVTLGVPPGEYRLHILPEYGTPYLETNTNFTLGDEPPAAPIVVELPAAAQVEVQVVDKDTGQGIENVDFWSRDSDDQRELHYTTAWEVATRIVHRDRLRTDDTGTLQALFEPGTHRIGVAWQSYPDDYQPGSYQGKEIECKPGEKLKVVFELERKRSN
ncbi:hypothetical protein NG895_08485 [Aeoliella sp. ICT_H6.2]|uniref:Peptidase M56 domain-containing protein n=1 Tax=Aeoliella straminimaris TaxID=2954799 RepID=A0A9X2F991_9BACT|nr:M56 family metallopeptidase [Aeoliella straminimaris]MCO6043942.1 hypothetical protein [Aeoliella straminimaris]